MSTPHEDDPRARLNALRRLHGEEHPGCAAAMVQLARSLTPGGDEAERLLARALDIQQKTLGADDPEVGLTARELGECYAARNDPGRAAPLLRLAADFCGRVLGEGSWQYAAALVRLAQVHLARRAFDEAELLYLRGLALLRESTGEDLNYSVCLNNLGMLYHIRGDDGRAEPLLRQVVDLRRRVAGEDHPLYLHALQDLAEFYRSRDDLARADAWQRQADEAGKRTRAGRGPARHPV
jgi:tetratricopeptide (TPR) repeat protein